MSRLLFGPLQGLLWIFVCCPTWVACTVDFTNGPPTPDSRPDVSELRDGTLPPDAAADAALDAQGPADAAADALPPVPDGGCPSGSKECSATCVSLTDPQTGCAAAGCDPCTFAHAMALCESGACAMGGCEGDWEDCNGNPSDGCEIDTGTDANNCGTCGYLCTLPHANMGCLGSNCQFLSCGGDWRDCDGNVLSNGCETDTSADNLNCGDCGEVCPSGFNCSFTACRCSNDADCNSGGGGVCDQSSHLCRCPIVQCGGPCNPSGNGCL